MTELGIKVLNASKLLKAHRETIANQIKMKKKSSNCKKKGYQKRIIQPVDYGNSTSLTYIRVPVKDSQKEVNEIWYLKYTIMFQKWSHKHKPRFLFYSPDPKNTEIHISPHSVPIVMILEITKTKPSSQTSFSTRINTSWFVR